MQDQMVLSSTQSTAPYSPAKKKYALRKFNPRDKLTKFEDADQDTPVPAIQLQYKQPLSPKNVVCVKTYKREDLNSIVPNSIDEDLIEGESNFLKLKENRILRRSLNMNPQRNSRGQLVNRSILGSQDLFIEKFNSQQSSPNHNNTNNRTDFFKSSADYNSQLILQLNEKSPMARSAFNQRLRSVGNSPLNNHNKNADHNGVSFAQISRGVIRSAQNHKQQMSISSPRKNFRGETDIEVTNNDLESMLVEVNERRDQGMKENQHDLKRMSLNQRLSFTRDNRKFENYQKYDQVWREQQSRFIEQRNRLNLSTNPNYRINKKQSNKGDITVFERIEYEPERIQEKEALQLAFPCELTSGQNEFLWSLRNSPDSCRIPNCQCQSDYMRHSYVTHGVGPFAKVLAQQRTPLHQKQVIVKALPFTLSRKTSLEKNKPLKTFKDYPEAQQKIMKEQDRINQKKLVKNYADLSSLYIEGIDKLAQEYESAKRISEGKRRFLVFKDSSQPPQFNNLINFAVQRAEGGGNKSTRIPKEEEIIDKRYDINHIYY